MEDKKSLASSEERAQISGKASLLAAVDYYVSMHSDIFVSASPGNMHNAVVSFYIVAHQYFQIPFHLGLLIKIWFRCLNIEIVISFPNGRWATGRTKTRRQ